MELARDRITGFPWNLLGTAQVDNIPLTRITTWTGVYGVSFEIMLVNVAVAAAFLVPKKKRSTLLMAALAAAAVLQAGRLVGAPALQRSRRACWCRKTFRWMQPGRAILSSARCENLTDLSVKICSRQLIGSRWLEASAN